MHFCWLVHYLKAVHVSTALMITGVDVTPSGALIIHLIYHLCYTALTCKLKDRWTLLWRRLRESEFATSSTLLCLASGS